MQIKPVVVVVVVVVVAVVVVVVVYKVIVQVSVVLERAVGGRFDNLSGSHLQSQSYFGSSVDGIYVSDD